MNNKIFKILTIVFMFGFFAVAKSSVNAVKVEEIVDGVLREGECSFIYRKHRDEMSKRYARLVSKRGKRSVSKRDLESVKFNGKIFDGFIDRIKLDDEFKELERKCGKERRDSIILVLMFKYINENSCKIFEKKGEKSKKYLMLTILSMRNEDERREDKFVVSEMGEHIRKSLMGFYKSLETDCFFELIQ